MLNGIGSRRSAWRQVEIVEGAGIDGVVLPADGCATDFSKVVGEKKLRRINFLWLSTNIIRARQQRPTCRLVGRWGSGQLELG